MCEEIPNPGKNVPKVILFPLVIGFLTAFPFAAALMYSIVDIDAVFNTATGLPLLEIYYQGTGSKAAASALLALFAFCFFGCLVANGEFQKSRVYSLVLMRFWAATTSSRTLWAVSRDGALPWSHFWAQVHPVFKMPCNAMLLSATCITVSMTSENDDDVLKVLINTMPDLRCHFHWIFDCVLCHGQCCDHLSANFVHHSTSNPALPWTRPITGALLQPWKIWPVCQRHSRSLGCIP